MSFRATLIGNYVSKERIASIIKVKRISTLQSVLQLIGIGIVIPSSLILFTLMKEALSSSETSGLTTTTRRHIPEDGTLHSHRRENLKSYIALTGWTL
jgi:hypothetical protein